MFRNRIRKQVTSKLDDNEYLQGIFPANTGPNQQFAFIIVIIACIFCTLGKYLAIGIILLILGFILMVVTKSWVFAITNKRFLIFKVGFWFRGVFPTVKNIAVTYPRNTKLPEPSGFFANFELGGIKYWVPKKFYKDMQEAIDAIFTAEKHNNPISNMKNKNEFQSENISNFEIKVDD